MGLENSIFVHSTALISSLGKGVEETFAKILHQESGLKLVDDKRFFNEPFFAGKIDEELVNYSQKHNHVDTRFDAILLDCVNEIQQNSLIDFSSKDTLIVLSTTKGNVELLENGNEDERLLLSYSAKLIQQKLNNPNEPIVISNACISGVSAIIYAKRMLQNNIYKHALVIGCDVLSRFVTNGFNSFHAISKTPCKPFDKNRTGISLGEACAVIVLSTKHHSDFVIGEGFISNDSNHISGPSKTGEELAFCIQESLQKSNLNTNDIDFISAHGTATPYNDEMESKAFELAGLIQNPVYSLKAIFGHTLGATGILEIILGIESLKQNKVVPSLGFDEIGVSGNIVVNKIMIEKPVKTFLKTASGFGGCNAALLVHKFN